MPLAKVATRVMMGEKLRDALDFYDNYNIVMEGDGILKPRLKDHIALKEAVFPFNKLYGADLVLSPEMKSTGEVMGISHNFATSYAKSQLASHNPLPVKGNVLLSFSDRDKKHSVNIAKELQKMNFEIYSTQGTNKFLQENNIQTKLAHKLNEQRPHIVDMLTNNEFSLVMNTTCDNDSKEDGIEIRRTVIKNNTPYITTISAGLASIEAIKQLKENKIFEVKSIQEYNKV